MDKTRFLLREERIRENLKAFIDSLPTDEHRPLEITINKAHCLFRPTKRSRNKAREIPSEEAVTTYDYSAHIRDVRMMRTRARGGVAQHGI